VAEAADLPDGFRAPGEKTRSLRAPHSVRDVKWVLDLYDRITGS
jgi:hypothetical protein